MKLLVPRLKDIALLEDIKNARLEKQSFHLWWLGQSGFLIQWQDRHLLLDPYLSDSLTVKYAHTDKPHIRMTELAIDPARLDFIDVVTSSHNHTDHLDAQTLRPLIQVNPRIKLIIPEANRSFVADRLQLDAGFPVGLNDGMSVQLNEFKITAVPAAHETVERNAEGQCKCLSYVIQFGPWTIYHSGDTMWFEDMVGVLKPFALDVAMLPINGRAPERRVAGNLNAEESAQLAKLIGAKIVIPHHYDMFTFNTADPQDFIRAAESEGQCYQVLKCGERWSSSMLQI